MSELHLKSELTKANFCASEHTFKTISMEVGPTINYLKIEARLSKF
jgi:hypothetical protein